MTEDLEEALGKRIINLDKQNIFAKTSKSEIDLLVFGALVRDILKDESGIFKGQKIKWIKLTGNHIRKISLELRITESRVSGLLEQCALMEKVEELNTKEALLEIKALAVIVNQETRDINEGKIRLYVPNKVTRLAIESFLTNNGGIPDTSFNRDQLIIRLSDLILAIRPEAVDEKEFFISIAKKANDIRKDKDIENVIEAANKRSGKELFKDLSTSLLKIVAGDGGKDIGDVLFKSLTQVLNK